MANKGSNTVNHRGTEYIEKHRVYFICLKQKGYLLFSKIHIRAFFYAQPAVLFGYQRYQVFRNVG